MALITIQLDSEKDSDLLAAFASAVIGTPMLIDTPAPTEPAAAAEEIVAEKPKRQRKTKEESAPTEAAAIVTNEAQAEAVAEELVEASPAAAPAPEFTLDDVRNALQAYTGEKGIQPGISLLASFGAGRISELKPTQYADFIAAAKV